MACRDALRSGLVVWLSDLKRLLSDGLDAFVARIAMIRATEEQGVRVRFLKWVSLFAGSMTDWFESGIV